MTLFGLGVLTGIAGFAAVSIIVSWTFTGTLKVKK